MGRCLTWAVDAGLKGRLCPRGVDLYKVGHTSPTSFISCHPGKPEQEHDEHVLFESL